jgi:lipopolysaccharide biosynthesis regulator YciM
VEARVKNDLAANRVPQRIEALRKELEGAKPATAEQWDVLARYLEADGKLPEAVGAVDKAIQAEPRSIAAWTLAARVRESAGNLVDAGDALRRLAEIDRRNRTEHLMGIAKIETRLGRIDAALKAGRDLLAAAPGNPENYEFFAQLCFQLGRAEEGLDALRRAVRVNPNDTKITLTLAETLAGQYRTDEAIEMYWRAFDKAEDLDGKLGTVTRLTELYLQRNQLDRLLTRLQHQERDARPGVAQPQQRDVAICMAQAYASSGDLGSARSELERLLASNTRDTQLLQQLSKLAEEEGDLESAARYQKQLNELTPSDDGASRLAQLYSRFGELEEAQAVWSKMASGKSEAYRIFGAIDSLLGNKKPLPVMEITESMIRKDPHDWEALYRQGLALAGLDKQAEAARRFQEIVDLSIDDDEKSAAMKARSRDPKLQAAGARPSAVGRQTMLPLETRMGAISQIRMACKLDNREMYSSRLGPQAVWSPTDFGQARMAALGWLVSLADKSGKEKGQEAVARIRKASEKTPANIRALWDWFYLCLLRYDNAAAFRAGQTLSRAAAADPLAAWAYLYAMGGRQQSGQAARVYVGRGVEAKDSTPPLEKAELDHALSCYASLRSRRPELAQALILRNVDLELKRAKRVEDEERFYRDSIAGATQLAQIAGSFGLAAERGDADALIQLADRLERLQSGRAQYYSTGTFYFAGTALSFSQGMSVCAQRKAYANVLRLLDHELAAARRRQEHQSPGAARSARTRVASQVNVSPQYQIWVGKTTRFIQIPFPTPNEYVDSTGIQLLRTAYELYKRDDLFSDLSAHFRRQAEQAKTPADAVYARLALAAFYWWNDDKENAIAEFTKVAEGSKAESELRLDLAELLEQQGERADALTLADSVQPLDNTTMKRREELALRLSVLTGDLERARQAAERLFGLRLDTETQVRLAGQMSQLGQHELAEAVLGRARRRAGNKATALVGLMLQYQRQGKLDVAVQVAMQILRSTTATRQTNPNYSPVENPDASRTAAIGVLARSGRLTQLIERAGEQLKKTPNVISIHQALADYFKAAGQRDKARDELAKIIALRPDDSNLRLQVAQQLAQEGQAAAAIEHYKAILKRDPAVLGRNFYQVQSTFQQANKTGELMDLLDQVDLRKFGQPYMVFNLISNLFFDNTLADRAVPLFKKAWEAFPDERSQLISYVSHDQIWQMPEMYEYAATSLIPQSTNFVPAAQWNAFSQIISYGSDGRINTVVSRLLDLAAGQAKLDDLAARVAAARKATPGWTAGEILAALIDCRLGRYDQASRAVRQFLGSTKDEGIPNTIFWIIGAELENHGPTRALAVTAFEASLSRESDDPYGRLNFDNGPAKRLISLYERDRRFDDARRVLLEFGKGDTSTFTGYPVGYVEQMKMVALGTAASKLHEMGFAADAVSLYNQSLALSREIPPGSAMYIGDTKGMVRRYRDGLTRALEDLKPEDLAVSLTRTLSGQAQAQASPNSGSGKSESTPAASTKDGGEVLDLMVMVHPRELDKATVRSLVADAIELPRATPSQAVGKTSDRELAVAIEAARQKHPHDLSVAIADTLIALNSSDSKRIETTVDRLGQLVEKTPLDSLADGTKANARQRIEAARQVPLWLVARACWKQKDAVALHKFAAKLAARALEAAGRQTENQLLMAMLREQGQLALDRGDRRAAEAAWSRMLTLVVAPPERKVKQPSPKPGPPARPAQPPAAGTGGATSMNRAGTRSLVRRVSYQAPAADPATRQSAPAQTKGAAASKAARPRTKAAAPAGRPGTATPRSNLPILTLDRFEQAMQIAKLAAEHDLSELSLRAVRDSLRAGPPVVPVNPNERRRVVRSTGQVDEGPVDQAGPRVIANLVELERLWRQHHAPDAGVYEALRDAVMPPGRPAELFLYATPLAQGNLRRPQNLGMLLATSAVRAGKVDDLKRAISSRQGQVMADLPASVLTALVALAANDQAVAVSALKSVAARLKNDSSRNTSELASLAGLTALSRPEPDLAREAITVLDASSRALENSGQPEPLGSLLLMLARRQFQLGDTEGGRKRLDAYLESAEKTTINYGGDYSLYIRKQNFARVAAEFARAGAWTEALAALGRFVDAPSYSGGDPPVDDTVVRVLRQLDGKPAVERYETLRTWTMPTKDRQVARILTSTAVADPAPEVFRRTETGPKTNTTPAGRAGGLAPVSTATALIDAARQAGKLDELAAAARSAADPKASQKVENADVLFLLIELARGQGAEIVPKIEARLAAIVKENEDHDNTPAAAADPRVVRRGAGAGADRFVFPWTDYLVSRTILVSDQSVSRELGLRLTQALLRRAEATSTLNILPTLRSDLALAKARRAGAPAALAWDDAGLALWHPAGSRLRYGAREPMSPSLWLNHEGLIAHVAGHDHAYLLFDYPLTGTFEFSMEGFIGWFAESGITHNGLALDIFDQNAGGSVFPVGQSEIISSRVRLTRSESFNRVTVQATPGKVRYLVNGHLYYEDDDPSTTSPWLGLFTAKTRQTVWRSLSLSGQPVIPREVRLSQGDRLEGWISNFYAESQPPRRTEESTDQWGNANRVATTVLARRPGRGGVPRSKKPRAAIKLDDYDWAAADGVLHGRRIVPGTTARNEFMGESPGSGTEADQSLLSYFRPLRAGDVMNYEFLYEPGQVMVHPALDRLAFLLEPAGVKIHWMTMNRDGDSGLPADNTAEEPGNRRGPAPLPLKAGQWNVVKLALTGDKVAIELNGQPVYERTIEPALGRQFGLFHFKDQTAAQARNIVLRGQWPEKLSSEVLANLTATDRSAPPPSDAARRARHDVIGETFFALEAGDLIDKTRHLPPQERLQRLADWVLPSPDHPLLRLEGDFTPSFPAPPLRAANAPAMAATADDTDRPSRVQAGGELRAPAIELVDAARSLGKLEELKTRVEGLTLEGSELAAANARAQLALLGMIAVARGDDATAVNALQSIKTLLEKTSNDQPAWQRWPELCLAASARSRPALRKPAMTLLTTVFEQAARRTPRGAEKRTPQEAWMRQVKHVLAQLDLVEQGGEDARRPFGSDPDGRLWARVTQTRGETRGQGYPSTHWRVRDGYVGHFPGHDRDLMYMAVPVRGDFQIDCELSSPPGQVIRLAYGGLAVGPMVDLKALDQSLFARPRPALPLNPPLEKPGAWYTFRLTVKGGRLAASINGRKVHDAPVAPDGDPWVTVLSQGMESGTVGKVLITGDPQVPRELKLAALPDLAGWLADDYFEATSGDNADWDKRGDEITGRRLDDAPGTKRESLLKYHRPMLEDGQIAYEFYYDPGKALVHPALGRLAFLLEPGGVKIHRLTDGVYERSGLAADNEAEEPENRRGPASLPLKPNAWNRLVLKLTGDKVSLELNGGAIFERTLEATNQRSFGLFHYADETEARARNVTHEGNWPRSLAASLRPRQN